MSTAGGLSLTPSLVEGADDRARAVLQAYFTPVSGRNVGFTGGAFDTFDPSGTRSASANTFTADDLVAVTLLSVDVPGRAGLEILDRQRRRYELLLEDIGPDRDLVEIESVSSGRFPPRKLWNALRELPGLARQPLASLWLASGPDLFPSLTLSSRRTCSEASTRSGFHFTPLSAQTATAFMGTSSPCGTRPAWTNGSRHYASWMCSPGWTVEAGQTRSSLANGCPIWATAEDSRNAQTEPISAKVPGELAGK